MTTENYTCDNCGHEADRDLLPPAKKLYERIEAGGTFTDKECPECGALCYPTPKKTPKKPKLLFANGDIEDILDTLKENDEIPKNTKLEDVCEGIDTKFDCERIFRDVEGFIKRVYQVK